MGIESQHSPNGPPGVHTTLNFYPLREDREVVYTATPSFFKRKLDPHPMYVENVRGREQDFTFDKNAIEWFTAPTAMKYDDFLDPEKVDSIYLPETERILKEKLGAKKIIITGPNLRRHSWPTEKELEGYDENDKESSFKRLGAARDIHVDSTPKSATHLLSKFISDEEMTKQGIKRWNYFSFWRPLKAVRKDPFCAADATTIRDEDLVVFDRLIQHIKVSTENYSIHYQPYHKFYFRWGMEPDDVMLVKFHDSGNWEGLAKRSPHTSFEDPEYKDAETRESIEVRVFALFDHDGTA